MEKNKNSELPLNEYTEKIISLFRLLKQDFREYSDQKTKIYNFTGHQLLLIDIVSQNSGINLQDLSRKLNMAKSNVSVIIERLVCKGIVIREIPEENRRIVKLSLAPEFLEKYVMMKYRSQYWADMFKSATAEELETIIAGLEKCHELISRSKVENAETADEQND
jgi:DNA-binding MarR family transcriptional regulator